MNRRYVASRRALAFLRRKLSGDPESRSIDRRSLYAAAWRRAAAELGAIVTDDDHGFLRVQSGERWTVVHGADVDLDGAATLALCGDKPACHARLRRAGFIVPDGVEFGLDGIERAVRFLRDHPGGCVVKPAADTGSGVAVTTDVRTRRDLSRAAYRASTHSRRLWVEEHLEGDVHRLLVLDGRLLDAVVRHPPEVVGDGTSTIRELVEAENARRLALGPGRATALLHVDPEVHRAIGAAGHSPRDVLPAGTRLRISGRSNLGSERETRVVGGELHEELVEAACRAATTLGARLAGVDVITTDPGRPLRPGSGAVLEVNTTPGLHWHELSVDRDGPSGVFTAVLRTLLDD